MGNASLLRSKPKPHRIKFGDYNIGRDGQLLTLPNYMQFLLDLEPEKIVLETIDVDALNSLAKEIVEGS